MILVLILLPRNGLNDYNWINPYHAKPRVEMPAEEGPYGFLLCL